MRFEKSTYFVWGWNGGKEMYGKSNFGELAVRVEKKSKFVVFYQFHIVWKQRSLLYL